MNHAELRRLLTLLWIIGVGTALFIALFHRDSVAARLREATDASIVAGSALYLLLGCLRGFTLIPVTSLVLMGLLFFPPGLLFGLTLIGILASSTSVYYFSSALRLDELLRKKHARQVDRVRAALERWGLPVIAFWAFFPFAPTDLICYLCGVLRIHLWKCLLGVAIGEGAICAIYIWLGTEYLRS